MLTANILWFALIGALAGLAFILILPFVMAGLIAWQALMKIMPVKAMGRLIAPIKEFNLPFVEAYLSGRKKKVDNKEKANK
jgi:hypothetical protein